jgi:hypothetical protein
LEPEEEGVEVVISTDRKIEEFAKFRFLSAEGKEIEVQQAGGGWMISNGAGSGDVIFIFKTMPGDLLLALSAYQEQEKVRVKVDLVAGLAVPKP